MEQIGLVRRVLNDDVELVIQRSGACGSCNACGGSPEKSTHIVTVKNSLDAKVGDLVELQAESKSIFKYTMIVYMIPFLFLITGIALGNAYFKSQGNPNYELLSFVVGILFLVISFIIVKIIDKKISLKDESAVVMTKVF